MNSLPIQQINFERPAWHITFSTHGSRLHGDDRPTVDRDHNTPGDPYLGADPRRATTERNQMRAKAVILSREEQKFVEEALPRICERGRWDYYVGAAAPDHDHVLCGADSAIHGARIRSWLKRWLGEALRTECAVLAYPLWSDGGSTRIVKDMAYFRRAFEYILKQRADEIS